MNSSRVSYSPLGQRRRGWTAINIKTVVALSIALTVTIPLTFFSFYGIIAFSGGKERVKCPHSLHDGYLFRIDYPENVNQSILHWHIYKHGKLVERDYQMIKLGHSNKQINRVYHLYRSCGKYADEHNYRYQHGKTFHKVTLNEKEFYLSICGSLIFSVLTLVLTAKIIEKVKQRNDFVQVNEDGDDDNGNQCGEVIVDTDL